MLLQVRNMKRFHKSRIHVWKNCSVCTTEIVWTWKQSARLIKRCGSCLECIVFEFRLGLRYPSIWKELLCFSILVFSEPKVHYNFTPMTSWNWETWFSSWVLKVAAEQVLESQVRVLIARTGVRKTGKKALKEAAGWVSQWMPTCFSTS